MFTLIDFWGPNADMFKEMFSFLDFEPTLFYVILCESYIFLRYFVVIITPFCFRLHCFTFIGSKQVPMKIHTNIVYLYFREQFVGDRCVPKWTELLQIV
jgi:hypothetical protein